MRVVGWDRTFAAANLIRRQSMRVLCDLLCPGFFWASGWGREDTLYGVWFFRGAVIRA